jgi:trimethylguanosine synthase
MKCAKHNAEIYGVDKKIVFHTGDCFDIVKRFMGKNNIIIFGSPPWGGNSLLRYSPQTLVLMWIGTEYNADNVFDLSLMQPYNLDALYKKFSKLSKHVVLYLPRNSDLNQIARYTEEGKKVEVAHYCIHGASKVSASCV